MDYLSGDQLTKLAQAYAVKPRLARPFPAAFYNMGTKVYGTAVKYDLVNGSRESAKITNPDSPSQVAQGIQTDSRKVVAIGSREHFVVGMDLIQALQWPGDMVRANAQMELERQVKAFVDRFMNIETNAVHSALVRGKIDVGSDGSIQASTSSPVRTIDYTGATGTQLTKDGAGGTFNIGDWSDASTDIVTKVKDLKRYILKTYGWELTDVYHGINVGANLAKNSAFREYLSRHESYRNQFVSAGEIAPGTLGLRWHAVDTATTVTGGSATSWAGDNFLAFSPDPSDTGWYEGFVAGLPAPSGLTSEAEIKSAMLSPETLGAAFPVKYGVHSYTIYNADPISAKIVTSNFSLGVIKAPNVFPRGVCA
jgi:hypothetical protein